MPSDDAGRIDVRVHFGNATRKQAHELFTKFYPNLSEDEKQKMADAFSSKVPELEFSMAHLQGFLMGHKRSPAAAIEQVSDWVVNHKRQDGADSSTTEDSSAVEDINAANMRTPSP